MWFAIDFNSHVPVYKQIKENLKALIAAGKIKEGEFVPSIRRLAQDLEVNLNTVARAYRELVEEGVLKVVRGMGYVVVGVNEEGMTRENLAKLRELLLKLKQLNVERRVIEKICEEVFEDGAAESEKP